MTLIDNNTMTGIHIPFGGFNTLSSWSMAVQYCCDAIADETYRVTSLVLAKRGIELQGDWNTICRYVDAGKHSDELEAIAKEIDDAMEATSEFQCDCDF